MEKGFWVIGIFATSFHALVTYLLRSLLMGLIWEIFIIVSKNDEYLGEVMDTSKAELIMQLETEGNEGMKSKS